MPLPLYIATSNMIGQRQRLDVVADNVANANTTGYKKQSVDFQEILARHQGREVGSFVQHSGTRISFNQGALVRTSNPLDVAIQGQGFFAIQGERGITYTRDGHFSVSSDGTLVNDMGFDVLDASNAPITIPQDTIRVVIASDGTISDQNGIIAQLGVFRFDDPTTLRRAGANGYLGDGAIPLGEATRVRQEFLESSNVNPVQETVTMTELSRKYQSAARLVNNLEGLEERVIRDLSRLP